MLLAPGCVPSAPWTSLDSGSFAGGRSKFRKPCRKSGPTIVEGWPKGVFVRVIGGALRSRRLVQAPPGVRPTSDRVREALFASLGDIDGARVLDLFAGTGSLGIEALSRGADAVVFVDDAPPSRAAIEQNLSRLGLHDRARVLGLDARASLAGLAREGAAFDLVFVDPPYGSVDLAGLLSALAVSDAVVRDAQVVVETATRETVGAVSGLRLVFERRYGRTRIARFEKR